MKKGNETLFHSVFIVAVFIYAGLVGFLHYQGTIPYLMRGTPNRESFQITRTAFAAISIFLFFPIIRLLAKKEEKYYLVLLALAEGPALLGFVLFVLSGAFKSFFIFFFLSLAYLVVVRPRQE